MWRGGDSGDISNDPINGVNENHSSTVKEGKERMEGNSGTAGGKVLVGSGKGLTLGESKYSSVEKL